VTCICRLDLQDPLSRLDMLAGPHRYPPSTAPLDPIGGRATRLVTNRRVEARPIIRRRQSALFERSVNLW
jgi:hypothetical protein